MFKLADQASISPPNGALILPKLFRRCTDYLKDRADGFRGTLPDWLVSVSGSGTRQENDQVLVGGRSEVPLSTLVKQLNDSVSFTADLLDIVFVEKCGSHPALARRVGVEGERVGGRLHPARRAGDHRRVVRAQLARRDPQRHAEAGHALAQRAVGRDAAADGEPVEAGLREPALDPQRERLDDRPLVGRREVRPALGRPPRRGRGSCRAARSSGRRRRSPGRRRGARWEGEGLR